MTEEEERRSETALWDLVLARIPAPFRGRIRTCKRSVILIVDWSGPARILATIEREQNGCPEDRIIMGGWPWEPIRLDADNAERVAHGLTDIAFDAVLASLPLLTAPPLELDKARERICWAPTGERMAFLAGFEDIADLKWYATRIMGFKHRVALADALREAVERRSRERDTTVTWGAEEIIVRRKSRAVVIHSGGQTTASILLRGGRYGDRGRTVAGADYGVIRDEDLLAPAVSFLAFED